MGKSVVCDGIPTSQGKNSCSVAVQSQGHEGKKVAQDVKGYWSEYIRDELGSTEIFVRSGIDLLWHDLGTYHFTSTPNGSNQIKYDPDILKIEEMLNSEMTEVIKDDILDFFLPMKDPIYALNATLPMLSKRNGYVHTMYKRRGELFRIQQKINLMLIVKKCCFLKVLQRRFCRIHLMNFR